MSSHAAQWDTVIGFPNTYQLNSDFTMQLLNNWGREWQSEISFAFYSASFTGCNYSISTWSSRVFSVRDLTQLKRGSWKNTKFLEGIRDFTIARVASLAQVWAWHVVQKKTCIGDSGWDDRSSGWGIRTPLPLFQTLSWSKDNRGRNSFISER